MTFDDLVQAARAAEAAGDLDGCAACQLEMYAMVQKDRSLLRRVDPTYLRIDHLIRVIAAALFAMERGDVRLASYYLAHFPQDFLPREEQSWMLLGNAWYRQGRFGQAVRAYGRALQEKARFPAAEENRRRAFAMMMAPDGASLAPISEPSQALGVDPEDWEEVRMLPIFINCRDRVGCLRRLVDWLLAAHPSLRKAGAALRYDDVTYRNAAQTIETEDSYYHAPLGDDVYFASVDTTFALYRNVRFYHRGPAVRMGGCLYFDISRGITITNSCQRMSSTIWIMRIRQRRWAKNCGR